MSEELREKAVIHARECLRVCGEPSHVTIGRKHLEALLAAAERSDLDAVKHAWLAGYTTGQSYSDDPPFAGLGKHNRQHGWELYACSLADRNLVPALIDHLEADGALTKRMIYFIECIAHAKYESWNDATIKEAKAIVSALPVLGVGR